MKRNLFLTFGEGRKGFKFAAKRLCKEVAASGWATDCLALDKASASKYIGDNWDKHSEWMQEVVHGYGLWIWKPLIIKQALQGKFGDYDRVLYLDAGCQFSLETPASKSRFEDYLNLADSSGGLAFTHRTGQFGFDDFSEEAWGNHELHNHLNASEEILESNQIQAGCLLLTPKAWDVIDKWESTCIADGYRFLHNPKPRSNHSARFRAHRHDQSVLSILWKQAELETLPDETWFHPDWNEKGRDFPIWTIRNNSSFKLPSTTRTSAVAHTIQVDYSRVIDKLTRR
jgi:hypothetical protein